MAMTDISVIIPTRNRAERLRRAIHSVAAQTRPPLEIIVVDDASSDGTPKLLAELQAKPELPSIRVIRNAERGGASRARNRGIAAARGELIGFLDDDDRWLPDKLALQAQALSAAPESVALVCCAYRVIAEPSGNEFKTWRPPEDGIDLAYFLRTTGFMTTIPLIRRACLEQVKGFDETLSGGQDLDLWIRLAERFAMIGIPEVLAEHRIHGEQITTDLPAKALAAAQILERHKSRLAAYPKPLLRHLTRAAYLHCAAGQTAGGQALLREAIALASNSQDLEAHLQRSMANPERHAAELIDEVFPVVEGVRLFY